MLVSDGTIIVLVAGSGFDLGFGSDFAFVDVEATLGLGTACVEDAPRISFWSFWLVFTIYSTALFSGFSPAGLGALFTGTRRPLIVLFLPVLPQVG